jgi:ABC-type Co2+ transport system permease subunit
MVTVAPLTYSYCSLSPFCHTGSFSILAEKLTYGQIAPVFEYVHDLMFSKNNSLSNLRVAISNVGSYYTCTITEYLIRLFSRVYPILVGRGVCSPAVVGTFFDFSVRT